MNQDRIQTDAYRMHDFVLLTVLISLFFGFMLGNRPLSVPDEGWYVEFSREMAATGDYLTPRLNGVKYFDLWPAPLFENVDLVISDHFYSIRTGLRRSASFSGWRSLRSYFAAGYGPIKTAEGKQGFPRSAHPCAFC
jgi:hypothetical protein